MVDGVRCLNSARPSGGACGLDDPRLGDHDPLGWVTPILDEVMTSRRRGWGGGVAVAARIQKN